MARQKLSVLLVQTPPPACTSVSDFAPDGGGIIFL
jgi:hypothetical protein